MKSVFLITMALVSLMGATGCGGKKTQTTPMTQDDALINTPGEHKVSSSAYVRGVVVGPSTNGGFRLEIIHPAGKTKIDQDLNPGWFVFVAPDSQVWAYLGGGQLIRITIMDKKTVVASPESDPELLKSAPKEVLANLPDTFKHTYMPNQTSAGDVATRAAPEK